MIGLFLYIAGICAVIAGVIGVVVTMFIGEWYGALANLGVVAGGFLIGTLGIAILE